MRRVGLWVGPCVAVLALLCLIWLPYLPNAAGHVGVDYAFWMPDLLAGAFWHMNSPILDVAWFSPAECAGVPLQADPQGLYVSVTQGLTFLVGPLQAVRLSFILYAAVGFLGTQWLARGIFGLSWPASVLAATLFALNGFYSARMMIGHLAFAGFMLTPALAACMLGRAERRAGQVARCLGFAVLLSVMLESGMAVLVLPVILSLAILWLMHGLATGQPLWPAAARAACGTVLGLMVSAGKVAAVLSLMAHLPRDLYPLPGFPNIAITLWAAFRGLFLWTTARTPDLTVNNALTLGPEEFDFRVGPAALLLMAAAAWQLWHNRGAGPGDKRARMLWEALVLVLVLPLALNTYATQWTALLKHIPILRSSSSLVRLFAAYIGPASLGAGIALDRLFPAAPRRATWTAFAAVGLTCICLLASGRDLYGPAMGGVYDPAPVETSWRLASTTGQVPAITALAVTPDAPGQGDISLARQNLLTGGRSSLFCYDPLFGYRLERFRKGTLHPGPILDRTEADGRTELNVKNPACYVFPSANACAPGDNFRADQASQALDFAAYRPFAFAKPRWALVADWVGIGSTSGVAVGLLACGLLAWRPRSARA